MRFSDKVVVVTGAGRGIGRACAVQFAREGANVVVVDVDEQAATATADLITRGGGAAMVGVADVADETAVGAVVDEVSSRHGRIDVLHNNAGILPVGTALTATVADWDRAFAVNVRSMFLFVRAVLPTMVEAGRGAIVNTASTAGIVGEPGIVAYGASKGAVVNLTRQLAADYTRSGVRVNCVCPGWVPTGFNDPFLTEMSEQQVQEMVAAQVPIGRQGTPEEIAAAVTFLASDEASFIAGQVLGVDGGVSACRL